MDPRRYIQDIIYCDICETDRHFKLIFMSTSVIAEHISDGYDKHEIVPFEQADPSWLIQKAN